MQNVRPEGEYPLTFRSGDVAFLEQNIALYRSIELIGMKRVGINNLIQYFFSHKNYPSNKANLFVLVDLNNLVEREIFPFWQLTLKRIVDGVRDSELPPEVEKKVTRIFESCIQYENLLMTFDGIREALDAIVTAGIHPVIFFTRFDRISNLLSDDFFANIKGIHSAAGRQMSFVFTSYLPLEQISKSPINRSKIDFLHTHYIKPANPADSGAIISGFQLHHGITIAPALSNKMIELCGGHAQYLQLALLIYLEQQEKITSAKLLEQVLMNDERIMLQSEELWESLSDETQHFLKSVCTSQGCKTKPTNLPYIERAGLLTQHNDSIYIFSPLLTHYVEEKAQTKKSQSLELTKKEHLLYTCLHNNINEICERETIIEQVWPEDEDYGISDWSIDKLVERLRTKLKTKDPSLEVITVRTRGYKMMKKN